MRQILLLPLMLTACNPSPSEGKRAELEYEIINRHNPTAQERCDALTKVTAGYLSDGREDLYLNWKTLKEAACLNAAARRDLNLPR